MSQPYVPYVILDRPLSPVPRHWTVFRGRKPSILLIDRDGVYDTGLEEPLAAEGFDVVRATPTDSPLELLKTHPWVMMVLIRMDAPGLDPLTLIRTLRETHPGLWIGMLCDPFDRTPAAEGYASGAADLFYTSAEPSETVARLIRSAPSALRLREEAARRLLRREKHRSFSWLRHEMRKRPAALGLIGSVALALALGAGIASVTRSWMEQQDGWNARIDRLMSTLAPPAVREDRGDRTLDRFYRGEQLDLQRRSQEAQSTFYRNQLEQDRLRDLFHHIAPSYSVR